MSFRHTACSGLPVSNSSELFIANAPPFVVPVSFDGGVAPSVGESDVVIVDYSERPVHDHQVVQDGDIHDRRVIAVAPEQYADRYQWVRACSDYIVSTRGEAFELVKKLSRFSIPPLVSGFKTKHKIRTNGQLIKMLTRQGLPAVEELLPTELKRRWKKLFGSEYQKLLEYSFKRRPLTVRVNTLTTTVGEFRRIAKKYGWKITPQEFSPVAFRIDRQSNGFSRRLSRLIDGGIIYAQDLASQLPAIALNPQPGEWILDIAAAPGSKTTQMAAMMNNAGQIVANDMNEGRFRTLQSLVWKNGAGNVDFHLGDGAELGQLFPETFDRVMVDVPCSCEGIFRYQAHKFFEWSPHLIGSLTAIQRDLILSGFDALRSGGTLVYSTCTFAPEENEAIVDYLIRKAGGRAKIVPMHFAGVNVREGITRWGDMRFHESLRNTIRIVPWENDSVGFYIAMIEKD